MTPTSNFHHHIPNNCPDIRLKMISMLMKLQVQKKKITLLYSVLLTLLYGFQFSTHRLSVICMNTSLHLVDIAVFFLLEKIKYKFNISTITYHLDSSFHRCYLYNHLCHRRGALDVYIHQIRKRTFQRDTPSGKLHQSK